MNLKSGYTKERKEITQKVLERENFKCADCGRDDLRLSIHHIDGSQVYGDWEYANNDLDNLVALCSFCHAKRHSQKKKNLFDFREQIISMYNHGSTMEDIARTFGVSKQRISVLCNKWGVIIRDRKYFGCVKADMRDEVDNEVKINKNRRLFDEPPLSASKSKSRVGKDTRRSHLIAVISKYKKI